MGAAGILWTGLSNALPFSLGPQHSWEPEAVASGQPQLEAHERGDPMFWLRAWTLERDWILMSAVLLDLAQVI